MLGAVFMGAHYVEPCTDLAAPEVDGPRDAIVRVTRSAICGTDMTEPTAVRWHQ
jgi:threonine dehydrogenase-like Zn-dependent dehydrogenase